VTKVMTKNIEDLLYRGDSLERMGEMSGRLREDSKKYRKAAVRINWELMLKQVSLYIHLTFWKTYGSPCVVWPFCWVGIVHYNVYLVAVLLTAASSIELAMYDT
jgi:Synaptobrevin